MTLTLLLTAGAIFGAGLVSGLSIANRQARRAIHELSRKSRGAVDYGRRRR